jgi:hypothetical protein
MSEAILYVDVYDTLVRMAGTKPIRQTCSALRCCVRGAQRNAVSRGVRPFATHSNIAPKPRLRVAESIATHAGDILCS